MKCRFIVDVDVNPATLPESERAKVQFRKVKMRGRNNAGRVVSRNVPDAYFPAGTIYERDDAWKHVTSGLAEPADEECAAFVGLSEAELKVLQRAAYRLENILKEHWPLFDAGVIEGYDDDEEHKTKYDGFIPGPNWAKYQELKAQIEADEEDEEDE